MIRVNLLPPEYRKAESTPAKQFFAMIGGVVLALLAVFAWGWVHFKWLGPATTDFGQLKADVDGQAAKLQDLKELRDTAAEYRTRYETIEKAAQDRLLLSQKLDQLWETLANPPAGRYEVWIKDLTMQIQSSGGKVPTGGSVKFGGISAGPQVVKLTEFHETLTESEFFQDCVPTSITQPVGSREALSADREPSEGWNFAWTMSFKPLKQVYEDRAKAKTGDKK